MPRNEPRLSRQSLLVLHMFVSQTDHTLAGSDILKEIRISSGSLYPILFRLEQAKWLSSKWEQVNASEVGRPRKRLYRLTLLGERNAREALGALSLPTHTVPLTRNTTNRSHASMSA